jgi:hypothetical protein
MWLAHMLKKRGSSIGSTSSHATACAQPLPSRFAAGCSGSNSPAKPSHIKSVQLEASLAPRRAGHDPRHLGSGHTGQVRAGRVGASRLTQFRGAVEVEHLALTPGVVSVACVVNVPFVRLTARPQQLVEQRMQLVAS